MAVSPTSYDQMASNFEESRDLSILHDMGRLLLDESGAQDCKLLFMMKVGPDQFNSGLFDPNPPPTFIGVFASTIRQEYSLNPHNSTISRENPSITLHEAKKLLYYIKQERPSMTELLYTSRDHFMTPEWLILRNGVNKIVSTQFARKVLQIVHGNVENICHKKYQRLPTKVYSTFYIANRMLDTIDSLMETGEISLVSSSVAHLEEILLGKYDTQALYDQYKARVTILEAAILENKPNLIQSVNLDFLNQWLIDTVRMPTL